MDAELTSERESWERANDKVKIYQLGHESQRMTLDESIKWKETEAKNEARRMD